MERMRTISSSLARLTMALGLMACQNIVPSAQDNASPKTEAIQAAKSSESDSRTVTDEEEELHYRLKDAWRDMLEGLDRDTVNKPKKDLVTPSGVERIYDPYQDSVVKMVFEKLYAERQQSDYFDDWPKTMIERSQRKKARKHPIYGRDIYSPAARILSKARAAQRNDYIRAGCRWPQNLRCLIDYSMLDTICSSGSDAAWGSSVLSDCKSPYVRPIADGEEDVIPLGYWPKVPKTCHFDKDIPSISRPDGYKDRYLPFHGRQIGDPKRGTVAQQFDQYFAINCPKFQTVESE